MIIVFSTKSWGFKIKFWSGNNVSKTNGSSEVSKMQTLVTFSMNYSELFKVSIFKKDKYLLNSAISSIIPSSKISYENCMLISLLKTTSKQLITFLKKGKDLQIISSS